MADRQFRLNCNCEGGRNRSRSVTLFSRAASRRDICQMVSIAACRSYKSRLQLHSSPFTIHHSSFIPHPSSLTKIRSRYRPTFRFHLEPGLQIPKHPAYSIWMLISKVALLSRSSAKLYSSGGSGSGSFTRGMGSSSVIDCGFSCAAYPRP